MAAEKIDDKMLKVLSDDELWSEWGLAASLYNWEESKESRRHHGAWIRAVVQAGARLRDKGLVLYIWQDHGAGARGDRLWRITEKGKKLFTETKDGTLEDNR